MRYVRFSRLSQVASAMGTFAIAMLLLDSSGLRTWAERLPPAPERRLVLPPLQRLDDVLAPLKLGRLRHRELIFLAKVRWSDDQALLAEVHAPKASGGAMTEAAISGTTVPVQPVASLVSVLKPDYQAMVLPSRVTLPELHFSGEKSPMTVALAGDSMMAVGLYPAFSRLVSRDPQLHVVKAFKSGTGLARPEVFNWQTEYPAMLAEEHPRLVIVAIGANDGQGFVQDRVTYPFGTDQWTAIYASRVEAYLTMLESNGARVMWLELPPMKLDSYNTRIALVNRIDYSVVSRHPSTVWVPTATAVGDAEGKFREYNLQAGKVARLRQPDGIHLSDAGAELVVEPLMSWLNSQVHATLPSLGGQVSQP